MSTACLNCGATVYENYCPRCGQKTDVKRLNWHSFIEELFHFFTHIEKGFLKTTGELIVHPGKLCKGYLDGKRKSYHKPISFLLIWITIYLLFRYLREHIQHIDFATTASVITWDSSIEVIIRKYRAFIELSMAPLGAFLFWLILARPKLNYIEVLSIYFYLFAFIFMVNTTEMIITALLGINTIQNINVNIMLTVIAAWSLYASYDLLKRYAVSFLIPRMLLWLIVWILTYFYVAKMIAKVLKAWGL